MPLFVVRPGTPEERCVEIPQGETIVGRASANAMAILDKSLSRVHAKVVRDGADVTLTDLGSTNGTMVNERRVASTRLADGDRVKFGDVEANFIDDPDIREEMEIATDSLPLREMVSTVLHGGEGVAAEEARNRRKLEILLRVAETLSSPEAIEDLLARIVDLLFQILDVDRAVLLIAKDDETRLEPKVVRCREGDSATTAQDQRFYSRAIVNYVRSHGVAVLTSDANQDERFLHAKSILAQSIRSSMAAPMKRGAKTLGVLYADNTTRPDSYSRDDLALLSGFAAQAAIALENSRLYRRIENEAVLRNNVMRFFPPSTVKRIMAGEELALGARECEVTSLFCDISNYTAISSKMEPIAIVSLLNRYFPVMADIVFRHEGTIEKYIGDALLAFWGAPDRHDDDADRAVRAAIEMQQAMVKLASEWEGKERLRIHVGLATGMVAAGNIGTPKYIQYAAIGDTTNMASRICGVAEEGEIVISEATQKRLRGVYDLKALPPTRVKGKDESLALFRVRYGIVSQEAGSGDRPQLQASGKAAPSPEEPTVKVDPAGVRRAAGLS